MAASMREPGTSEQELWKIVRSAAEPLVFSPALANRFDEIIRAAIQRIRFDRGFGGRTRALETKQNFGLLIQTMKDAAKPNQSIMDIPDLEASLRTLCPLFPIC